MREEIDATLRGVGGGGVQISVAEIFFSPRRDFSLGRPISLQKLFRVKSLIDRSCTDNLYSLRDLSLQTSLLLNSDQTLNKELDLL